MAKCRVGELPSNQERDEYWRLVESDALDNASFFQRKHRSLLFLLQLAVAPEIFIPPINNWGGFKASEVGAMTGNDKV